MLFRSESRERREKIFFSLLLLFILFYFIFIFIFLFLFFLFFSFSFSFFFSFSFSFFFSFLFFFSSSFFFSSRGLPWLKQGRTVRSPPRWLGLRRLGRRSGNDGDGVRPAAKRRTAAKTRKNSENRGFLVHGFSDDPDGRRGV